MLILATNYYIDCWAVTTFIQKLVLPRKSVLLTLFAIIDQKHAICMVNGVHLRLRAFLLSKISLVKLIDGWKPRNDASPNCKVHVRGSAFYHLNLYKHLPECRFRLVINREFFNEI